MLEKYTTIVSIGAPTDSATILLDLQPSGSEHAVFVDSASEYFDLQPSGTETKTGAQVYTDSGTKRLAFTPSGSDTHTRTAEAGTRYLDLQPSGVEVKSLLLVDAATLHFKFDLSESCEIMAPETFSGTITAEARWDWRAADRYTLEAMERWTDAMTGVEVIRC